MTDKENETRLAILDLEGNLVGYKVDTFWTLSTDSEDYKIHPFEDTKSEGHLACNLLFILNENSFLKKIELGKTQYKRCLNGLIVSVQDVSKQNFGKELLRYRILKEDDKYVVKG